MSGASDQEIPIFRPERDGFDRYLEDTIVVDWQTPAVFERARELAQGHEEPSERARAAFEFVRDEIDHSFEIETDVVTCSASHVLREGTGLCYAKSHLLAALLRARGIPVGFAYQRLLSTDNLSGYALHGFVVAWLSDVERWVALDARGDNEEVETKFQLDRPSLAYVPDVEAGEQTLPLILARPAKRVVELLDRAESLNRIRRHLPDSILP
ncbi:MAG: transglutaminase family protein [Deltaproteobacteria bacterium]|nr:transglutaminase family protein [Deltaproteobacteria bacterium]MBW2385097.1 transglutaminase family protein [Deltaproteobacteria bacterium]MBW2695993.1 transglutaminase family protein [Deltaproteobacteria bacterium]